MANKKPLDSLQTLAKGRETRWQRSLTAQLGKLQAEQQRLEQLNGFAREYGAKPEASTGSQSILAVRGQRQFVDRLHDAVGQQRKKVAAQQALADRDLANWKQARAKRMALDKFADRQLAEENRKRERSAQRALDEVGTNAFLGRRDK